MKNSWMQQIQSLLGQKSGSNSSTEGIGKLLAPGALGGLVGVLLANKSSRKLVGKFGKNALIIGGSAAAGAVLWNKYKSRVKATHQDEPQFGMQSTPVDLRAKRLVQALVFAAKSDGHIDDDERRAIDDSLTQLQIGEEAQAWVQQAIEQPLNPDALAFGVKNEEEALEVYYLSCMVIDVDHFMERGYLDALARSLKIPDDVKQGIEGDVNQKKRELA
ncbi:tellurite resistance TerB family protein [Serratia rubidaea]|uniref:tellurite resistance TerB family protein n=1 Tax=Serratia rubidaea TaxID=61652 RepID=UPI00178278F0|nr:tellurite resistance TerB family protein [Serratia rubidaea]MBD8452709.1 tellurite resistance TerB family protein [Serratia rubidaea]UJD80711.1 tellurite resistance TerB family protein [Serratia rubidaea]UJD85267.1 tellurite resistance TerB family protein [Serratia rubidaea]